VVDKKQGLYLRSLEKKEAVAIPNSHSLPPSPSHQVSIELGTTAQLTLSQEKKTIY
jgi:hypothetical protein